MIEKIILREEEKKDFFENENLTREAFWNVYKPGCDEHFILKLLRNSESYIKELSLVAVFENKIVGNIVYSKMFKDDKMSNEIICFGPISVHPDFQKKGIGSLLINTTSKKAKDFGYKAIFITGNKNYYKRFGFKPAFDYNIHLEGNKLDDRAEYFMVKELEIGYLNKNPGIYNFDKIFFNLPKAEIEEYDKLFPTKIKREKKDTDINNSE